MCAVPVSFCSILACEKCPSFGLTMSACDLPDTLTPDLNSLTPTTKSLLKPAPSAWGRLFPMLNGLDAIDLEKDSLTLGRSEGNDVTITETKFPSRNLGNISKVHFMITRDCMEPLAYIKDLSKNGTFVNDVLVGKNQLVILQHGDEISISFKALKVYKFTNFQTTEHHFLPQELREKYEVSRTLGEGAGGTVKLIFEKRTCKQFAVKRIVKGTGSKCNSHSMHHPDKIKNEIDILKSVSHPCIISVFEVVDTEECVFIVMEYMEGGELTRVIRGSKMISEQQVKFIFYQIVLAVRYLHRRGITHRDLKPENILLKDEGTNETLIKITDFGLSKLVHDKTLMKTACGTPLYVAPEILDHNIFTYTRQVDVWSMGVILYQMLSQKLPFRAENEVTLAKLVMRGTYDFKGEEWNNISFEAKDIIKQMLITDPSVRITVKDILKHPWLTMGDKIVEDARYLLYSAGCTEKDIESDFSDSSESTLLQPSKRSRLF